MKLNNLISLLLSKSNHEHSVNITVTPLRDRSLITSQAGGGGGGGGGGAVVFKKVQCFKTEPPKKILR